MSIGYPDFFSYSLTEKFNIWSDSGGKSGWLNLGDTKDMANVTGKYVIDHIRFYIQSLGEFFAVTIKTYIDGVLINSFGLREHTYDFLKQPEGILWTCNHSDCTDGKQEYWNREPLLFNTSFQITIWLSLWDTTQLLFGCTYNLYSASPEVIFYPK